MNQPPQTQQTGKRIVSKGNLMERLMTIAFGEKVNLPAPDTLVRASEEPVQAQKAMLLRAATETRERHEEQLVRAAGGTE